MANFKSFHQVNSTSISLKKSEEFVSNSISELETISNFGLTIYYLCFSFPIDLYVFVPRDFLETPKMRK